MLIAVGIVLNATVATNQAVVAVVAAVRLVVRIGSWFVFMPTAIGSEMTVGVIGAVGTVVRIFTRLIVTVGMIRAVLAVPCIISRSDHAAVGGVAVRIIWPQRMVVVVVIRGPEDDCSVYDRLVDVGVVVVADAAATAPVHAPGAEAPSEAAAADKAAANVATAAQDRSHSNTCSERHSSSRNRDWGV